MKYQIFILTLISLRIANILCSNTITDCEINEFYDHNGYQKTVTLFCGRPAESCRYYGGCSELCYNQIFIYGHSTSINSLKIGDCRGNRLNTIITEKFTELKSFDISNHGIRSLSSLDLNFSELSVLNAGQNHLVNISDSLFINTPAITEIDFSHNEIATIHPDAFKGAKVLTSLDLSSNSIQTLDQNSFKDNKNLTVLKLGDNPIQRIDENMFTFISQFPSLKLFLSCETIYDLDGTSCGQFSTPDYYYRDNNDYRKYKFLALRCSSVVESQLICNGTNFKNLKYFNISGNQLQNVDNLLNTLVDSSIEILDLSSNYVGQLNENAFEKFTNLKYLDLRNTQLYTVDFVSSNRLSNPDKYKTLETLRVDNNPFTSINCSFLLIAMNTPAFNISFENINAFDTSCATNELKIDFDEANEMIFRYRQNSSGFHFPIVNFKQLKHLNMSGNELENTTRILDLLSPSIEILDLSSNFMREMNWTMFDSFINLRELNLKNTSISSIHLEPKEALSVVQFEDNPIIRIDSRIWSLLMENIEVKITCGMALELDTSSAGYPLRTQIISYDYYYDDRYERRKNFANPRFEILRYDYDKMRCVKTDIHHLKYLNISENGHQNAAEMVGWLGPSIETLDVSSNHMGALNVESFSKFINLKYLDVRNTSLSVIDFPFARYHKKLQVLRLEQNPIKRIDCNIYSLLLKSIPITITTNDVSEIDTSCMKNSIKIIELNNNDEIAFRSLQTESEMRCKKSNFQQLTYFNITENQLLNAPALIDLLGPPLETLDVSFNYVGKITAQTFDQFSNLKYLNLSRTELSNFQFTTFYHQRRLKTLDVSFNHLGRVNFTLFVRIFKDLETLNLEGNDLIEINSVTKKIFPKLFWLGISKNHFSCDYLGPFLHEWNHINLLDNPSSQTHIDGTDCHHNAGQQTNAIVMATTAKEPANPIHFDSTTEKSTVQVSPDRKAIINFGLDTRFNCDAFFDGDASISCDEIQEIGTSCLGTALKVIIDSEGGLIFQQPQNYSNHRNGKELRCPKKDLQYMKRVNFSGNQLGNLPQIIAILGPSVETLDLSSNFIGKLNESTFQPFDNLQYLNLSRTHLSNFSFDTFYHQTKLSVLDLSYNHMKTVNFTLLLLNFKNLRTLNLEGNDLMEIDTVIRFNFPKLSLLAISKNNFSCDYLVLFLRQWDNLQLLHNPSNQMAHIGGTDCFSKSQNVTNRIAVVKAKLDEGVQLKAMKSESKQYKESDKSMELPKSLESHLSADMQMLKYLFLGICIIWCLNFVIKSKWFSGIRRKMNRNVLERIVAYQPQQEHDAQQSIELIEKGSVKE